METQEVKNDTKLQSIPLRLIESTKIRASLCKVSLLNVASLYQRWNVRHTHSHFGVGHKASSKLLL
jgi:hypothetical protein